MTASHVEVRLQTAPVVAVGPIDVTPVADQGVLVRLPFLKTNPELADPIQSAVVKGWLRGDLQAPE